jgi:hypothetical protein
VTVHNRVAIGASALVEDRTPAYLGTQAVARCAGRPGCALPDTESFSGAVLRAVCQMTGDVITNADLGSPGIENNPYAYTSNRWYGIVWPDGRWGLISEAYLEPGDRGGLGLPLC